MPHFTRSFWYDNLFNLLEFNLPKIFSQTIIQFFEVLVCLLAASFFVENQFYRF